MHAPLLVANLAQRNVITTVENRSLRDAAELMRQHHVGCLVVVGGTLARVVGILTDRDIAIVAMARDFDPHSLRVADVMHTPVHTIDAGQPAIEALLAMRRHGVRRLPVTGEFGELAGIVSLDDLLEAYASDLSLFAHAIRRERQLEQRVMV